MKTFVKTQKRGVKYLYKGDQMFKWFSDNKPPFTVLWKFIEGNMTNNEST